MPAGYELTTLVHGILEAGRAEPALGDGVAAAARRDRRGRRDRRLRHPDLTALPAGRAAGVQARTRVAACHGPRDRGHGVRGRRRPARRPCRPGHRRRRSLCLGGRGARGRVRRARAHSLWCLSVHTLKLWTRSTTQTSCSSGMPWLALAELPPGAKVFDAHTHLGEDIDGMVGDRDELLAIQRGFGIERSFVFCLDEPDRRPAFTAANDRTLAPRRRGGRGAAAVRPARPGRDAGAEATRCIDRGARGIKLHPRAQRFLPDDPRLEPVFALAAERPRADPDPRRPRSAADRGLARPPARPPCAAGADRRARGHRRPGRDGGELRGAPRGLLRHLGVEPARPARPVPARPAGAGRLRLRLPVRPAAELAADGGADGACERSRRRGRCGRCSTTPRRASPTARSR